MPNDCGEVFSPNWTSKISELYGPLGTVGVTSPSDRSHDQIPLKKMFTSVRGRESPFDRTVLKRLVKKNKVSRLVDNFVAKLKRGVAFSSPVDTNL